MAGRTGQSTCIDFLEKVRVPTLGIHGADDPMFPPAHGVATAEAIPGAKLLMLEGLGPGVPRA